jgi:hypothetical protein
MSLPVSFSVSITTDRSTLTLNDTTVYPTRSNYYVFLDAYKVDQFSNKTALAVTPNASPNTVTSWTVPYDETAGDGWYQFLYVAPQAWAIGTTYNQYDAVYYNGNVYTSIAGSNIGNNPTNASFWTLITDPPTLALNKGQATESTNLDSLIYDRVFSFNGQYFFANMFQRMATGTDSNNQQVLAVYDLFSLWLSAITICDSRSQTIIGEQLARAIETTYIDTTLVFSSPQN